MQQWQQVQGERGLGSNWDKVNLAGLLQANAKFYTQLSTSGQESTGDQVKHMNIVIGIFFIFQVDGSGDCGDEMLKEQNSLDDHFQKWIHETGLWPNIRLRNTPRILKLIAYLPFYNY